MWKNNVDAGGSHMTIWRMRIACWITKATDTHSEYVIFIAFPLQQWLQESASLLRYRHSPCFVNTSEASCAILRKLIVSCFYVLTELVTETCQL
jgi:hypothetical protein